jgi:C4-dicarboxylate-specific signal transduction histidine kinase
MTSRFPSSFRSIRGKLTLAAVTPLVVILLLVALAATYLINASIVNQTQKQIRNDLNAARILLTQEQQRVRELVRITARSAALPAALASSNRQQLAQLLRDIKEREQLDILNLTDLDGLPLLRDESEPHPLTFARTARQQGQFSGILLLSESELRQENPALAEQARIYSPKQPAVALERRGMALISATPVINAAGQQVGILYGGILLNNNLTLIDRISELVYSQESFEGIGVGSATIFLGKLRVATTIRLEDGKRALGTQVSQEVAEAVLQRGETWLARAFVVKDWYLTAYEPIVDDQGLAIGALYVGMLEKPFSALKQRSFLILFGLLILGCLLGGLLAGWLARRLSRPVLELASSAEKIAGGEREIALPVAGQDEIGHLTEAFADMAGALKQSDEELQSLNRQLEKKVAERTTQLEEKSLQLIKTQEQLLRSEKLAAIGSLAAGVAHEINNPAAIIRGNVEILQMSLPENAAEHEEAREIMKQVERVSLITQNLLSFAGRQDLYQEQVEINQLLEEILGQICHQQPFDQVKLILELTEIKPVPGDQERLRQVFTNIILNALQAMEGTGILRLGTTLVREQVVITISDNGPGIPEAVQEKIFNPFFTTKQQGTGLGLSTSYGIIQAHAGTLELQADHSPGASFKISLPLSL